MDYPRKIWWSGRQWGVKRHINETFGPGNNYFSDSQGSVWVDNQGNLHLKIRKIDGKWYCSEVVLLNSLGYGRYITKTVSFVDRIDKNAVLGIFTYDYNDFDNHHKEIDIELSKWGENTDLNAQFVIQPWDAQGNRHRFRLGLNGTHSSHIFDWKSNRVKFYMLHGHYDSPPNEDHMTIDNFKYVKKAIYNGNEQFRLNLWLLNAWPPSDSKEVQVIFSSFKFIPA